MTEILKVLEAYVATPENGVVLELTRPEVREILDSLHD